MAIARCTVCKELFDLSYPFAVCPTCEDKANEKKKEGN